MAFVREREKSAVPQPQALWYARFVLAEAWLGLKSLWLGVLFVKEQAETPINILKPWSLALFAEARGLSPHLPSTHNHSMLEKRVTEQRRSLTLAPFSNIQCPVCRNKSSDAERRSDVT